MVRVRLLAVSVVLSAFLGCPPAPPPTSAVLQGDGFTVRLEASPFSFALINPDGTVRQRVVGGPRFTRDDGLYEAQLVPGWDDFRPKERPWTELTQGTLTAVDATHATVSFTADQFTAEFTVTVEGAVVRTHQQTAGESTAARLINKSALAFEHGPDDHYFGMGQRTASTDHRGLTMYSWAEEGGLGGGETVPAGPTNPFPNGPSMTYFPVPLFHTTRGLSVLVDGTRRSEVHFGSTADELKLAIDGNALDLVLFVRSSPLDALDDYTARTGRPPVPAQWAWGPRRRINAENRVDGEPEWKQMRARKLPLTSIDDAMHALPSRSHAGREAELRAWTSELHAWGYKVDDYNNPYVSASAPASADLWKYGAAQRYFEMAPDGGAATSFFLSGGPQTISTVDLTNPDAVKWFQGLLRESFELGYDGWMHDFGEYVQRSSRFSDGRRGDEVHNLFPVLSVKAMAGAIEGHDAHVFSRSGYTGSQAWVLENWGGDGEASFDETQGIPAMLRGGLNLSAVAVPYWSTDIGGYKCLTDAPHDKEMLVRWYEMSALSPMMHDQDACSNPINGEEQKATLWDDTQTQDIWREMAGLHTRLAPYFRALALEAHAHGRPITLHPMLTHPTHREAWKVDDSFFVGAGLYAAPVVRRGLTSRRVWLPPGRYVEWTERTVHVGDATVEVPAPLDRLPLFLVENQLVPLLDRDVQTLAPATMPDVVTEASRSGVLDVIGVVGPSGTARFTLADGTELTITRLSTDEGNPQGLATAPDDATLQQCAACGRVDVKGTARVMISSSARSATLKDVRVEVRGGPARTVRWEVLTLD